MLPKSREKIIITIFSSPERTRTHIYITEGERKYGKQSMAAGIFISTPNTGIPVPSTGAAAYPALDLCTVCRGQKLS